REGRSADPRHVEPGALAAERRRCGASDLRRGVRRARSSGPRRVAPTAYLGSGSPLAGGSDAKNAFALGCSGHGNPKLRLLVIASGRILRSKPASFGIRMSMATTSSNVGYAPLPDWIGSCAIFPSAPTVNRNSRIGLPWLRTMQSHLPGWSDSRVALGCFGSL